MKINGKQVKSAWEPEPLVFDRGVDENGQPEFLVIRARGIKNFDEFDRLCPEPKNTSGYLTRDGWQLDPEAPEHLDALDHWRQLRAFWMTLKTLEPSNIEWEKVHPSKPNTWVHVDEELGEVLNFAEINRVRRLIQEANSLNGDKLEENRLTFFQMEKAKLLSKTDQTGHSQGPENSKSGEPA